MTPDDPRKTKEVFKLQIYHKWSLLFLVTFGFGLIWSNLVQYMNFLEDMNTLLNSRSLGMKYIRRTEKIRWTGAFKMKDWSTYPVFLKKHWVKNISRLPRPGAPTAATHELLVKFLNSQLKPNAKCQTGINDSLTHFYHYSSLLEHYLIGTYLKLNSLA